jgi:type IV pilus assembly protein PilC
LASVLKRFPVVFSDIYVSLVSVGEKGGVLPFVLDRIIDYLLRQRDMIKKFQKALTYPVVVLVLAVVVFLCMFLFFIPMFTRIFKNMNIEMPMLTQYLINVSDFFIKFWWIIISMGVMIIIGILKFKKTKKGRYFFDKHSLRLPLFGPLIFYISLSRFLHTLCVLLESGVILIDSLNEAINSMGNIFLKERFQMIHLFISKGMGITDALEKTKLIPDFSLSLIAIGEQTGSLAKNLKVAAEMVDEDVDSQINKITAMIGPIAILFVSVLVGVVLVGIYLPIFSMWGGLAR